MFSGKLIYLRLLPVLPKLGALADRVGGQSGSLGAGMRGGNGCLEETMVRAGPNSFCFMNFMAWGPFLCTRLGRLLELRVLGREDTELLSGGGEDAEGGVGGLEELDGRAWANMKRRLGASSWKWGGLISRMPKNWGATSV